MSDKELDVGFVPALLSDTRCSQCGQLLGSEPFWCLTCNEYVEMLSAAEQDRPLPARREGAVDRG